jgi:hypothetical protein
MDETVCVDCHGTDHGFGHNSIKNSSIRMGLGIIALPIDSRTKKLHFTTVHPFFGGDTAFLTCGGNGMGIVQEQIRVLAITSSKIVQFAWEWAS